VGRGVPRRSRDLDPADVGSREQAVQPPAPAASDPHRLSRDDPIQPALQALVVTQAGALPPRLLEPDLHRFGGIGRVPADQSGEPQEARIVHFDERREARVDDLRDDRGVDPLGAHDLLPRDHVRDMEASRPANGSHDVVTSFVITASSRTPPSRAPAGG
jgi:hypothetical protein